MKRLLAGTAMILVLSAQSPLQDAVTKDLQQLQLDVQALVGVFTPTPIIPNPITSPGFALLDAQKNKWEITPQFQISLNGTVQQGTNSVNLLLYYNGTIYQQATIQLLWWKWENNNWVGIAGDPRNAAPVGPPIDPASVPGGYTMLTFNDDFCIPSVGPNGPKWFTTAFFGSPTTTDVSESNCSLTIGAGDGASKNIQTVGPDPAKGWTGLAFGGGAYVEATISFNPQNILGGNAGWPAWWGMSIEHLGSMPQQHWAGQASNYLHFIETDFFEYDVWGFSPPNCYGGAIHDWFGPNGQSNVTNSGGGGSNFSNFQICPPSGINYTQPHKFGFLWVPATPTTKGFVQWYFDGVPTSDKVTWDQFTTQSPPPGSTSWTFGILDSHHIGLILGSGSHEPMTVTKVQVWQKDGSGNLSQ